MIVPAKARKAMGLEIGDDVVLVVKDDGEAVIAGVRESIARAQRIAQKYKKPGRSAVQDLLDERKREAAGE